MHYFYTEISACRSMLRVVKPVPDSLRWCCLFQAGVALALSADSGAT